MLLFTYAIHAELALNKMLFCYSFCFGIGYTTVEKPWGALSTQNVSQSSHSITLSSVRVSKQLYGSALLFPLIWDEGDAGEEGLGGAGSGALRGTKRPKDE